MLSRIGFGAFILACGLIPQDALAHVPLPGFEGFQVGLLHPLSVPNQLLALLGLGVMFGLSWPRRFVLFWALFAISILFGITLGQMGVMPEWRGLGLLTIAVIAASLAAIVPSGIMGPGVALSVCGGLLIGIVSTPEPGPVGATIITVLGTFVSANLAVFCLAFGLGWIGGRFTQHWAGIGLRIVAAWTAAVSALMASLRLAELYSLGVAAL